MRAHRRVLGDLRSSTRRLKAGPPPPRLLTFPDTLSGRIGVFPSRTPDEKPAGPAHGTVEVPADRIVWPFVNQTGADPMDLQFLRQLSADGIDRLTVRASAATGSGPADLAHLTSLSRLSIHAERLAQPSSYSDQLDELRLDVPEADGRMVTDVVSMPRPRELYLRSKAVTDAGHSPPALCGHRTRAPHRGPRTGGRRGHRGRFEGPARLRPRDGATEIHQRPAEQDMQPNDPTRHPMNFPNSSLCPHR